MRKTILFTILMVTCGITASISIANATPIGYIAFLDVGANNTDTLRISFKSTGYEDPHHTCNNIIEIKRAGLENRFNSMISVALAAQMSGKKIRTYSHAPSDPCKNVTYIQIYTE